MSVRRQTVKGWLLPVSLTAVLTLGGGAQAPDAQAQSQKARTPAPKELRVAVADFTGEKVDPIHGGIGMMHYQGPLFDYLVTMGADRKPVPGIARDWEVSPDGKTYTFNLRKGMKWHNGDDVTAEDVKAHFERLMSRGTGAFFGIFAAHVASMEVKDPYRIVFRLKEPWPDFIDFLGPGDTSVAAITPKKYVEKVGDDEFARKPVGSGPWRLVERRQGSYFLFEAAPGHPFRPTPGFQRLRIMLVPEESTRLAMLQRGEVDVINIGFDSMKQVERMGQQVLEIPNAVQVQVMFGGIWEPRAKELNRPTRMESVKVRQALARAIDRKELVQFMVLGRGQLAERFPAFPGAFGYDPSWEKSPEPYDPEGAKRLLREAGYPNGFSIRLYTLPMSGAPWLPKMAQVVAEYWKRIGVTAEVVTMEWGSFGPLIYGRPDEVLGQAFTWRVTNSSFPVGRIQNYVSVQGKALIALVPWDEEYKRLAVEVDRAKRERAFRELMNKLQDTYVCIPLFYANAAFGARKEIKNWHPFQGWPEVGLSFEYFEPAS